VFWTLCLPAAAIHIYVLDIYTTSVVMDTTSSLILVENMLSLTFHSQISKIFQQQIFRLCFNMCIVNSQALDIVLYMFSIECISDHPDTLSTFKIRLFLSRYPWPGVTVLVVPSFLSSQLPAGRGRWPPFLVLVLMEVFSC